MGAGVGIARLGQFGQRENSQVARLEREDSFTRPDAHLELGRLERLDDEIIRPRRQPFHNVFGAVARRKQDHIDVP